MSAPPTPLSPSMAGPSRPSGSRKASLNPDPSFTSADLPSSRARPSRRTSAMSSGSATAHGGDAEQRRARREQLRNFYGLKGVAEGKGEGGSDQTTGETALDSNTFDAAAYYEHLISSSSLEDLMKTASSLAGEIGNLQSSRHALVYNHHHQLFSAGDTISHLNSRTPQLLGIMTELQDSFSEISRLVDVVAGPKAISVPHEGATGQKMDVEQTRRLGERVRLMVLAEEPPEKVRERYAAFQLEFSSLDEAQRSELRDLRLDCEALVGQLPEQPSTDGIVPMIAT